ncbi:MAG: asparagine synthetase B [Roseofilum sp. SBFL]|uniref:asparagine synthetase B family protein n=1 Tax=unclassified Roseofilum TaxID=2620099 RepID=UPI001B199E95|nr:MULTISPECIES: asparagine synthase-related protein [unclassified Roseofilum]MBP0014559.1 asparagine synthetase B [Roseofilum sp. SID3]MBP0026088.1 asparagine synthetase B [Roseofilum sp. SID2]MBP0038255.1 asparagine synthetase B [Roseofilum sp. SID1]MBP0044312.1 asparagine synthetase B [Roseofilum sp. SBFL]
MSGIVGIVNADNAPVDRELLARMTGYMTFRGPDVQRIWAEGSVGFGHTLLRTTDESANETQPLTVDRRVWIVADARVDGRRELIRSLQDRGKPVDLDTPDPNLILDAYQVWGIDCLDYLIGDFAFAIWDGREQRLFCARDRFGVKPFFYAHLGKEFVFSNTLNCVRLHPSVSEKLNDLAIADFLLFGYNQEIDTSAFADIQRLPAAHRLIWTPESFKVERYWTLPTDGYIRYKRDEEYVEQFLELMRLAVGDRLRTNKVAVYMSGGLDSTSVTAIAKELLTKTYPSHDLRAYTTVFDRLLPDEERYYSGLVAQHLDIPIHYRIADDFEVYKGLEEIKSCTPEPTLISLTRKNQEYEQQITDQSRIGLSGEGGDGVFGNEGAYYYSLYLIKKRKIGTLLREWLSYWRSHGRFPQPGIRARIKEKLRISSWQLPYPVWLNPQWSNKLNLTLRWRNALIRPKPIHPVRPEAYFSLTSRFWPYLFENYDPGITHSPLEVRYPYFDLRVIKFLLSIPVIPWMMFKELLRVSMKNKLPESVRTRPKTPAMGNSTNLVLQQSRMKWVDEFDPISELSLYINHGVIPNLCGKEAQTSEAWINLRPISLNYWLEQLALVHSQSQSEVYYVLTV